jgi:predicted nucleic acid-binding protein
LILVDTSVLLDVITLDPVWEPASRRALDTAAAQDDIFTSDIVYAELSPGYETMEKLDAVLAAIGIRSVAPSREALFLAGHAFRDYRRRGGPRTNVLPDFIIGAHAAAESARLLTRDPARVRAYFPSVELLAP